MTFTIIIYRDPHGSGCTVEVPALPGCVTCGDSLPEALAMARDAIGLYVQCLNAGECALVVDPAEVLVTLGDCNEAQVLRLAVEEAAGNA
jgi:predicted RNase H-like HicB family nuclease